MRVAWIVATYTFRELLRRKVFVVVPVVTAVFLGLYFVGAVYAFRAINDNGFPGGFVDQRVVTGSTILGLSMFATFFLGTVLAVFLTFGSVRGDAEVGLLQPLVVRPVGRTSLLAGRFLGTAIVSVAYVVFVYSVAVLITGIVGGWWPEGIVAAGLDLAGGVVVVTAISILGSNFLTTIPNGLAVLGVYGAGLVAGLLGQVGHALSSHALESMGRVASWVLPFEALYQASLHALTAGATGLTGFVVSLGPLGGAEPPGRLLIPWAVAYVAAVGLGASATFTRRDL